jgi:putative protease
VTKVYREALDAYARSPRDWQVRREWRQELDLVSQREYTAGFFAGKDPGGQEAGITLGDSAAGKSRVFAGLVLAYDREQSRVLLEQRNYFKAGDLLEFVPPEGASFCLRAEGLSDEAGRPAAAAPHPQQRLFMPVSRPVAPWTMIRRVDVY